MNSILARTIVGTGFPPDEGAALAEVLLSTQQETLLDEERELEIDLRGCDPALLISAFVNGFLQQILDAAGEKGLAAARQLRFVTDFDWQQEDIGDWLRDFNADAADVA